MFAKLFELVCFHIMKTAERAGWRPRKAKPVVRVRKNEHEYASLVLENGIRVGQVTCVDYGDGPRYGGFVLTTDGRQKWLLPTDSEADALEAMIAELSKWAEVDTGEVGNV